MQPGFEVYDSISNRLGLQWGPLDDVVMGGSSQSSFSQDGSWTGTVITENGGFAGVRTIALDPPLDFSGCEGLVLRVRGNGRRFKFIVRDDASWNGVAWAHSFDTAPGGAETVVRVPFGSFVPTKFAQMVSGGPALDTAAIFTFQLTYSKFEYSGELNPNFEAGPFALQLLSIKAY